MKFAGDSGSMEIRTPSLFPTLFGGEPIGCTCPPTPPRDAGFRAPMNESHCLLGFPPGLFLFCRPVDIAVRGNLSSGTSFGFFLWFFFFLFLFFFGFVSFLVYFFSYQRPPTKHHTLLPSPKFSTGSDGPPPLFFVFFVCVGGRVPPTLEQFALTFLLRLSSQFQLLFLESVLSQG